MPSEQNPTKDTRFKTRVLRALRERVAADLATATGSQMASQSDATHPEARAEHAKDTRSTELSYLARGLAERVAQLREEAELVERLEPPDFGPETTIALGALVQLEPLVEGGSGAQGEATCFFLAPAGGGLELDVEGRRIRIVTPRSPIGRSLIGRSEGDEIEIRTPQGSKSAEIVGVE